MLFLDPADLFWAVRPRGVSSLMAKLTTAARKKLPKSDFADKGARKYPIPDAAHATGCLVEEFGKTGARRCCCGG